MTAPYYAKGETGRAFMTVAEATTAPSAGNSIEIFVDDYSVADVGDYIVFKGLGYFQVDGLIGDNRRITATNQDVPAGTAIPAGTKVFVDLGQYTPSSDPVPQPDFNTPVANGNEITITWNTAPAWVQIQYWKYGDVGTQDFKLARGVDGVIKFKVPWTAATYLRAWGIDANERRSAEVDLGYVSAAIPTPSGITVTPGAGKLKVQWAYTGYETWVQIWRIGLDDFQSQDIDPLDSLGNQVNSIEFQNLAPGNYYVRIMHNDSVNWGAEWWSDNGSKDGNGPGWAVTSNLVNPDVPTPQWLPLESDDDELIVKWDTSVGINLPNLVKIQYWKTGDVESNKFAEALGTTGELRIKTGWQGLTYARGWGVDRSGYWDSEAGSDLGNITIGLPAPAGMTVTSPNPGELKVAWNHIPLMTWVQIWRKGKDDYRELWTWAYDDLGNPISSVTFNSLPPGNYFVRAYHYVEVGSPFSPVTWSDNGANDGTGPGYIVAAISAGSVDVDEPSPTALSWDAGTQKLTISWDTVGAPYWVQIQAYNVADWGENKFFTVLGSLGTVSFTPQWSGGTVVRGWGIDADGNWSDEVNWATELSIPNPTISLPPTPSGVVVTPMPGSAKGVLRVGWAHPGDSFHTWVQIWRTGVEDFIDVHVPPEDELGNNITYTDFVNLRNGDAGNGSGYQVRVYHYTKFQNPQRWSDIVWMNGSGNGYTVEQVPNQGDVTQDVLENALNLSTGGIQFTGTSGHIYATYTSPTASLTSTPGFFLGKSGGYAGFVIGNSSKSLRYRGDTGALELQGGDIIGGTITIGTGTDEFLVDSTKMQYGGTGGLVIDRGTNINGTGYGGLFVGIRKDETAGGVQFYALDDLSANNVYNGMTLGTQSADSTNPQAYSYAIRTAATRRAEYGVLSNNGQAVLFSTYAPGSPTQDSNALVLDGYNSYVHIEGSNSAYLNIAGGSPQLRISGTKVIGARATGWGCTLHGTPARNIDLTSATLGEVCQVVSALLEDMGTAGHGMLNQS